MEQELNAQDEKNKADMLKAIEQYRKHKSYMAKYNKKPGVKAKRKRYNAERWQMIKKAMALEKLGMLNEDGSLREEGEDAS